MDYLLYLAENGLLNTITDLPSYIRNNLPRSSTAYIVVLCIAIRDGIMTSDEGAGILYYESCTYYLGIALLSLFDNSSVEEIERTFDRCIHSERTELMICAYLLDKDKFILLIKQLHKSESHNKLFHSMHIKQDYYYTHWQLEAERMIIEVCGVDLKDYVPTSRVQYLINASNEV